MILAPAGEQFRRLPKATHTHLQAKAAESYTPIQMDAARDDIFDIFENTKNTKQLQISMGHFIADFTLCRFNIILRVMYGKFMPTAIDARALLESHATWRPAKLDPHFLGTFPRISLRTSFRMKKWPSSLFGAGSDATAVAIMVVVMAAACYPKAQEKVQEELDTVIGRGRSPTLDDYGSLPQIEAFTLEYLRWRPVTTLGFAHRALTDIPYKDICIPEGAIVFGNHWAISRDPNVYPNPDKFDPERWLGSDGKIREDLKFPSYGFGRRICPGRRIANRSIFIKLALVLWSFKITQDPENPID
ncbi:cytochrome P450 [Suillus plorans]|uniref:Cytochrome P450 n=1 Tax=Suillus plorans TaxID=116603 RepID=A0A9P7E2P1_9AGAM|nr:cytochrome P450 [Suillus plorans]KAG1809804.1 cytochrome P450 [Suillus plorans]